MFWVARNKNGQLVLLMSPPMRHADGYWRGVQSTHSIFGDWSFPYLDTEHQFDNLKWEDNPIEIVVLPQPTIESIATNPIYHRIYDIGMDDMANHVAEEVSINRVPDYCKQRGCYDKCAAYLCDGCENWDFDIIDYMRSRRFHDKIIKETTHGMANKEMRDLLAQYPDDAIVAVECCDVRRMGYCEADNTIRID